MPDRGHAANNGGADQRQHERTVVRVEHADHPLIAGKQARHAARRGRIDREQRAGNVDHAGQAAVAGHVDAMVVARAEVDGGEAAVVELRRQVGIATHQRGGRIVMALGLEDLVLFDRAELAERAIDRAHIRRIRQRPHALAQRAGEEGIEAVIAGDVRIGRLAHVDPVLPHEAADDGGGDAAPPAIGHQAGEYRHCMFGEKVLRQDSGAIGHGGTCGKKERRL